MKDPTPGKDTLPGCSLFYQLLKVHRAAQNIIQKFLDLRQIDLFHMYPPMYTSYAALSVLRSTDSLGAHFPSAQESPDGLQKCCQHRNSCRQH